MNQNTNKEKRKSTKKTNEEKLDLFRSKILKRKPLNTLLNQYFDENKESPSLIIPLSSPSGLSFKLDLFFNCKCFKFPFCIYDYDEVIQAFAQMGYSSKSLYPCKGCGNPLDFKFFFKDQKVQFIIDSYWKQYNIVNKGEFCKEVEITRFQEVKPILIETKEFLEINEKKTESDLPPPEHYPEFEIYEREQLMNYLFLYEKNLREKPDAEVFGSIFGIEMRNRDLKIFIDNFVLTKKLFRMILMHFYITTSSVTEKNDIIFLSFKQNFSYKLDEKLGTMKTSAKLLKRKTVYFFIRCSKKPKFYTFCRLEIQKRILVLHFPYHHPQKDTNLVFFLIKSMFFFLRQQFSIEVSGLSIIWVGLPPDKDLQFGNFTLFHYYSVIKLGKDGVISYHEYMNDFSQRILWFLLFSASMKTALLRKNYKDIDINPQKRKKREDFNTRFNAKFSEKSDKFEIFISKTHHEIIWKSQEKPAQKINIFDKKEPQKSDYFELFPKINQISENSSSLDVWNLGGDLPKQNVSLSAPQTQPSRNPQENLRKFWKGFFSYEEDFERFWSKGLQKPETPFNLVTNSMIKAKKTAINAAPDLEKVVQLTGSDFDETLDSNSVKGEIFDFDKKEIRIKKHELWELMKQVKNEGIKEFKTEQKLKNPDDWYEKPKIIDELGPAENNEAFLRIKKAKLRKLIAKKEEKIRTKLQSEEDQQMLEYMKNYDKFVELYNNKLRLDYILGYYYFTNPELYQELKQEYEERLANKTKVEKEGLTFNQSDFQKKEDAKEEDEVEQMLERLLSESKQADIGQNQKRFSEKFIKAQEENKSVPHFLSVEAPIFSSTDPHSNQIEIIAKIATLSVSRKEYQEFRSTMFLSENMLNFLVKYFNSKNLHKLKEDYHSVEFHIQAFPTEFMRELINKREESFLKGLPRNQRRNFFQRLDFLLIPFYLSQDHCAMIFVNFREKKFVFFDNMHSFLSGRECVNDPHIEIIKNFLEKDYKKSFLRPSTLYEWSTVYEKTEYLKSLQKTSFRIARYLYVTFNMRADFNTDEYSMKIFHENLCNFFMNVGINKKNLKPQNFVL